MFTPAVLGAVHEAVFGLRAPAVPSCPVPEDGRACRAEAVPVSALAVPRAC
ncbi:hypothetical protein [Streptomyces pacificus]|uniref:hypothetical protein n=1 Tax=Streptomyces pacificus TaxID=2705029 RepID=UPI0015661E18|nr:hypothetical protein [Streptomyces pacificus]